MPAPEGNKFALGNEGGRPRLWATPFDLQEAINEYFANTDNDPIYMWHSQLDKRSGSPVQIKVKRPYTVEGLCHWLGTDRKTLINYEKAIGYEEFFHVIKQAKLKIHQSQIESAMVGVTKENFTKFLLINNADYVEKTEQKVTSENINYNSEPMTKDEMREIGDALENDF